MFSLEREQLQWLICIISLWNCYFNVFVKKYYCFTFEICLVVFLDLIDIYTDTKITKIGAFIAKLQAHPVFRAAILNFLRENPELRFGSRHFWIQHTRKPPDANFYASIRKCTPNSHIRPTWTKSLKYNYDLISIHQSCLQKVIQSHHLLFDLVWKLRQLALGLLNKQKHVVNSWCSLENSKVPFSLVKG